MSIEDSSRALSSLRKKRGIVRRSITRLVNNLKTLEATPEAPGVIDQTKQLIVKLEGFDKDFRSIHYEIVDLFDEDSDDLEKEHEVLDKHEDYVTATSLRLQKIIANSSSAMDAGNKKALSRKLARVERHL